MNLTNEQKCDTYTTDLREKFLFSSLVGKTIKTQLALSEKRRGCGSINIQRSEKEDSELKEEVDFVI